MNLDDLKREVFEETYTGGSDAEYYALGQSDCIDYLHAQGRIVPDGYVAVPLEPTDAMIAAGDYAVVAAKQGEIGVYKAMISAAQKGN